MVFDFPEALYIQETLEHGINCVKVDLLFLDYHQVIVFCHNFKLFLSENIRSGLLHKENRDKGLVGSVEELAVSVKQLSLSQREPFH